MSMREGWDAFGDAGRKNFDRIGSESIAMARQDGGFSRADKYQEQNGGGRCYGKVDPKRNPAAPFC